MINHDNKYVFIQIPKTGSDSVCSTLLHSYNKSRNMLSQLKNTDIFGGLGHHCSIKKLINKTGNNFDNYFIFTFVRNPYDRLVSEYLYIPKYLDAGRTCLTVNEGYDSRSFKNKFPTFTHYVKSHPKIPFVSGHETSQKELVDGRAFNFIGRFENIQEDFNYVCDKIGIERQQLQHRNKTTHKHYTEYYDEGTRQIVAEKYAKDIEYFGYKFGE